MCQKAVSETAAYSKHQNSQAQLSSSKIKLQFNFLVVGIKYLNVALIGRQLFLLEGTDFQVARRVQ